MKKSDYQFPGVFSSAVVQKAFYTPDCTQLPQSTANPHYLWDDRPVARLFKRGVHMCMGLVTTIIIMHVLVTTAY